MSNLLDRLNAWLDAHRDKVYHALAGVLLALIGLALGLTGGWRWSLGLSAAFPVLIGFGKEVWDDHHPPHQADVWDFMAVLIGAVPVWAACFIGRLLA